MDSSQFLCSILEPVKLWASPLTPPDLSYESYGETGPRGGSVYFPGAQFFPLASKPSKPCYLKGVG